jgi:hypothetical protein
MAPKSKGGGAEEKAKEVLTAVLLADSFTQVRGFGILEGFHGKMTPTMVAWGDPEEAQQCMCCCRQLEQ